MFLLCVISLISIYIIFVLQPGNASLSYETGDGHQMQLTFYLNLFIPGWHYPLEVGYCMRE